MEHPSFLLLSLLVVAFSVQLHARESKFFSKTMRFAASKTSSFAKETSPSEVALPPQSHNGYGLYSHDYNPNQSPSTTTKTTAMTNYDFGSSINDNAYKEPNYIPSSLANADFSAQNYESAGRNYHDSRPRSFTGTAEQTHEKKVSNYPYYDNQNRYGMSDTRVMENGKYFYDVNKENYDEPMNSGIDSERSHGSNANNNYGENARNNVYNDHQYKNDLEAYLNSNENQENEIDYIDP